MRKIIIAGVGCTKVGEHWDKSLRYLASEAGLKALEDAKVNQVDSLYASCLGPELFVRQGNIAPLIADYCGLGHIPAVRVESACSSGGLAFREACLGIASGVIDSALVVGVEKMTDVSPSEVTSVLATAADQEVESFHGATFLALNAMVMRAYMKAFGTPLEQFSLFAVNSHRNAVNNPYAQYTKEITLEDAMSSPVLVDPVRLMDCCPMGDGSAAIVLCAEDSPMAKKVENKVRVLGLGCASDTIAMQHRKSFTELEASKVAAAQAYKMSGLQPKDIDVVEIHDAFTVMGLLGLEDFGFVKKGEAGKFVEKGEIGLKGSLPTNTFGGLKARGHPAGATGLYQISELYWQLTNKAGKNQITDAKHALAQNIGGAGTLITATILGQV